MTAMWESQLESISLKSLSYQSFIGGVQGNLELLIDEVKNISFIGLPTTSNKKVYRRKTKPRAVKK
jgi:DNA topoisomerase-3